MAWTVPTVQVTAVLGEVTVMLAATSENVPLTLVALKPFADTRTFAVVLAGPVAVQAKLPWLGAAGKSPAARRRGCNPRRLLADRRYFEVGDSTKRSSARRLRPWHASSRDRHRAPPSARTIRCWSDTPQARR